MTRRAPMDDLEARSAPHLARMLAALRQLGVTDEPVLAAMDAVPRHEFVNRFWSVPPSDTRSRGRAREHRLSEDCADEVLAEIYDPTSALLIRTGGARATSSLSAPIIVGLMLAEMQLTPGLRVLEIGTGSGYNAALLASLVGQPALVTTIDVDAELIGPAQQRLDRLGFGSVAVRQGDGAQGVADRAPFDRIAATVGCVDIAPAWVAQLAAGGQLLVPLEHGAMHPRVLLRREEDGQDLIGRFVGRSAFVRMQGSQADHPLWPGDLSLPANPERAPLPRDLGVLDPDPQAPIADQRRPWDLSTYVGMRDRRALSGVALGEGTSTASLRQGAVYFDGPQGAELADRLVTLGRDWVELGCPGLERYGLRFTPRPEGPAAADSAGGPWVIDRIDYRQHVVLEQP
jgi:protein-L-isoaspartate(D-aspartate) O-methyltransferase